MRILRFPSKTWFKLLLVLFFLLLIFAVSFYLYLKSNVPRPGKPQPLAAVQSTASLQDSYDVIVVGTDPEGIAAAVSSARNGLKTLLMDGREREILGGLMTIGWLNSLDHNYDPNQSKYNFGRRKVLNGGIFQEWYDQVEGDSFDVHTAANAFYNLVRNEPNIDLAMKVKDMQPLVINHNDRKSVKGIQALLADGSKRTFTAPTVIDATQDADIAFAAGIPFTKGREDIGDTSSKMAVTVVFRITNITDEVWNKVKQRLNSDDDKVNTGANELSAWGYQEMWDYVPKNQGKLHMRGLNIGRQNDQTALINALQIFNIDPQNKESVKQAFELGKDELPNIIAHMKEKFPEFKEIELAGTAPELYVRESRHMNGLYRLSIVDVLDNRDQPDRIAFGSYNVDLQSTEAGDRGSYLVKPKQYAIPFRSIVPKDMDGILVVGRCASYDSLAHGSARVIPVGMATGQAAGAAAKLSKDGNMSFREIANSTSSIQTLQTMLNDQGMKLKPFQIDKPEYAKSDYYPGLKAAAGMFLVKKITKDTPNELAKPATEWGINQDFKRMKAMFPEVFIKEPASFGHDTQSVNASVSLTDLVFNLLRSTGKDVTLDNALEIFKQEGFLSPESEKMIQHPDRLTAGECYMIYKDFIKKSANAQFE